MANWSRWIGTGVALGILGALAPVINGDLALTAVSAPLSLTSQAAEQHRPPELPGLDLTRLTMHPRRVTTRVQGGQEAELTLDPELQRSATGVMKRYRIPEAGVVVMDVKTGELLVYASHVETGKPFDVNVRAEAPAASTFKVITAAALVERGLNAHTEQCYHGGTSGISASELEDSDHQDKWCASLAMATGRSLNVVFGRLATKHLTPEDLTAMGGAFGFGAPLPFPVANEAPKIEIPIDNPLEFARSAAGFWHTTLSPLAGASIAQAIANRGVALEPRVLRSVYDGEEKIWTDDGEPRTLRRAVSASTAAEVTKMMTQTVASGSAFNAFHDRRQAPYLPQMEIAGKTGTLTRHKENRHYTWFIGFAPATDPQVAISALVVNTPVWTVKAPDLARDVLRAYFAKQNWKGVTRP